MQARNGKIHGWPGPSVDVEEGQTGAQESAEGFGRPLLPAPLGTRGNESLSVQQDGQDLFGEVLVVRAEREADPLPPLRQVRGLGPSDQEVVER